MELATANPVFPTCYTPSASRLVEVFLSGKSPTTIKAYGRDLKDFACFVGASSIDQASEMLFSRGHGGANEMALSYRSYLIEKGLTPATVNRHLASLRSLVHLARTLGLVTWTLELQSVKSQKYRDTTGTGLNGFRSMLAGVTGSSTKAVRDRVILRLLWDLALRREEVVSLDLSDVDLQSGTIFIMGKGRREKEKLTLPSSTMCAIRDWIAVRGGEAGALLTNMNHANKGQRITGAGLYHIIKKLGKDVGLTARPHGIRHASITSALDKTNGNVRAVQRFSRHKDIRTLAIYDDNRNDLGGEVAAMVSLAA